jgi:serine/threonine protein kinase
MGEVYRVLDRVFMERVALKTVLSTKSDSPRAGCRLVAEASLARRISHPNVCRVHDVGVHCEGGCSDDQLHFLTMELIEGRRLGQVLMDGALSLDQVDRIAHQILLGLCAAHAAGVLHRDLKSDNVMIAGSLRRPRVVITDFGLSRTLDRDSRRAIGTRGHERVGSLAYMPPEQIWGGELGPESDVFGFGVVLFEMLTGVLPFRESSLEDPARRQPPPPPSAVRPGVCGQLDALVLGCLNPDPGSRLHRAEDVLEMLRRVRVAGGFSPPRSVWPRIVRAALGAASAPASGVVARRR